MSERRLQVVLDLDTGRYSGRLAQAGSQMRTFGGQVAAAGRNVNQLGGTFNNLNSSLSTPLQKLRDYVLILGNLRHAFLAMRDLAVGWVGGLIMQSAEVERLTTLLHGLSNANTEIGRNRDAQTSLADLYQMARTSGFEVRALADAMVKFRSGGLDPATYSLRGLVDAVAAFGGTSDTMHRASIAIQQMAGKGVISMEELRQQLGEAVPTAMRIMAHTAGQTMAQFTAAVSKGRVQARVPLQAMLRDMQVLYAGAGERLASTMLGQLAQLRTNITQLSTEFTGLAGAASSPFIEARRLAVEQGQLTQEAFSRLYEQPAQSTMFKDAKSALQELNDMLRSPEGRQAARDLGAAVGAIGTAMADSIRWVVTWRREIGSALSTVAIGFAMFKAVRFGEWLGGMAFATVQSARSFGVALTTMSNSAVGLGRAIAGNASVFTNDTTMQYARASVTAQTAQRVAAAAAVEVAAIRSKIAAYAAERMALISTVATQRARVVAAQQAIMFAQRDIDQMGLSTARTQALAMARNVLTAEENLLAAARERLILVDVELAGAEAALAVATTEAVVATEAAAVSSGTLTMAYRVQAVASGIATAAGSLLTSALALMVHPLALVAAGLAYAAYQAGIFGSQAEAAASSADRLRRAMGDLADARQAQSRIEEIDRTTGNMPDWALTPGMGQTMGDLRRERAGLRQTIEGSRTSSGYNSGARHFNETIESQMRIHTAERSAQLQQIMQRENLDARMEAGDRTAFARREQLMRDFNARELTISRTHRNLIIGQFNAATTSGNRELQGYWSAQLAGIQRHVESATNATQVFTGATTAAAHAAGGAGAAAHGAGGRVAGMQGQVAQLTARLNGSNGALARFNAELAGGRFANATAAQIAQMRNAAAAIDAMHQALGGRRADEAFADRLANVAGRIAQMREELAGGQGELARFNAQVEGHLFEGVSQEKLDQMREYLTIVDQLAARGEERTVATRLSSELAKATEEADRMWDSFRTNTVDADQKVNSLRSRFAGMLDPITDPAKRQEFEAMIDRVTTQAQRAEMATTADGWRTNAENIRISLMAEDEQRQANFDREVARQQALLDQFDSNSRERFQAEQQFQAWKHQATAQFQRENESATTKMARQWARLGSNIQGALAGALSSFVDGMFEADFNFGKFAIGIIKSLLKIILQAAIAYALMSALGMANNSSGQHVSFGSFMKGQLGAGFGGGSSTSSNIGFAPMPPGMKPPLGIGGTPSVGVTQDITEGHIGGVIGALSTWTKVRDSDFRGAKAYHRGGEIGGRRLRAGEVPMIGMKGEVVLTEEHQAMLSRRLVGANAAPPVQVNVINNSGTEMEAEHGQPDFNGREWVLNVVIDAANRDTGLRRALKGLGDK